MRSFQSDNASGLCPEALEAMIRANDGQHRSGYGADDYSEAAIEAFQELFGPSIGVGFVATGTAANTLAIASLTEPWEQVFCHPHSHYNRDESTAPEALTRCRTTAIHTEGPKLLPEDIDRSTYERGDVHQPQPGVLTLSNVSELGLVYTPAELRALCERAHARGYRVHLDGARFANAVAALNCDPRALTVDAGVDALSFGGTKNGLAYGEAVVFIRQGEGERFERAKRVFPFFRKSTGHLLSKHRFVTAPFAATLRDDIWLRHAARANAMARRLSAGLESLGLPPRWPTDANGVFLSLPEALDTALRAAGHRYYPFGDPQWKVSRLMCSFDTSEEEVDSLLECAAQAIG